MSDRQAAAVTLELAHTMLSEEEALRFLDGHRITRGGRIMDPKAQIVIYNYIIANMYAKAVTGTPTREAIGWAEGEIKRVYES